MLLELGVVVDLEVRALVDAPGEVVVLDLVLAEVRDELRLRPAAAASERQEQAAGRHAPGARPAGVSHGWCSYRRRTRVPRIFWGEITPRKFGSSRSISSKYDDRGEIFCSSP